jgi:hypothetical protein
LRAPSAAARDTLDGGELDNKQFKTFRRMAL